ncbi:MAG: HSP90 family protein [Bacteroidia bacterium]
MKSQHYFQVNLGGMIEILSNNLYSEKKVFIRELLQNATDAIRMRELEEEGFRGKVTLDLIPGSEEQAPVIMMEDNGIGLNEDEIHRFLASIGSSIKRESAVTFERKDFIGQFGIGLLSCFMVTDEIVVITRSARGGPGFEWIDKADGSYDIRQLDSDDIRPGTKVYLKALKKPEILEEFFSSKEDLKKLVRHYGDLLPYPILLEGDDMPINRMAVPFGPDSDRESLLEFGREVYEVDFLDAIPLQSSDGETTGVAFVLPYQQRFSAKQAHRVYLRRMLVADKAQDILPGWAVFVKCIINSNTLRPTASRESFYEDEALRETRESLGLQIEAYLTKIADKSPHRMKELLSVHGDSIKLLAVENDSFFKVVIDALHFQTNFGDLTIPEYLTFDDSIRHMVNLDTFRQVAPIAAAHKKPLINSAYTYDARLLNKLKQLYPDRQVQQVSAGDFLQDFDTLSPEEEVICEGLVHDGNEALKAFNCKLTVRNYDPEELYVVYYANDMMDLFRDSSHNVDMGGIWGHIMSDFAEEAEQRADAHLVLNYKNALVQKLAAFTDSARRKHFVSILYVQALMQGHFPLQKAELEIMEKGLSDLLEIAMS